MVRWFLPVIARKHILVVDDYLDVRTNLARFLASEGYEVDALGSGEEALVRLNEAQFDIVVTDNRMPGMSGAELARAIKSWTPFLPIVMLSANPPAEPVSCVDVVVHKTEGISKLLQVVATILSGSGGS